MNNPVFLSGLSKIYPKFDIFFVDLWGVIHNGIECYSEALKVLKNLKKTRDPIYKLANYEINCNLNSKNKIIEKIIDFYEKNNN